MARSQTSPAPRAGASSGAAVIVDTGWMSAMIAPRGSQRTVFGERKGRSPELDRPAGPDQAGCSKKPGSIHASLGSEAHPLPLTPAEALDSTSSGIPRIRPGICPRFGWQWTSSTGASQIDTSRSNDPPRELGAPRPALTDRALGRFPPDGPRPSRSRKTTGAVQRRIASGRRRTGPSRSRSALGEADDQLRPQERSRHESRGRTPGRPDALECFEPTGRASDRPPVRARPALRLAADGRGGLHRDPLAGRVARGADLQGSELGRLR